MATIDELTLGEVKALTADWKTAPPLVFLVEALVKGFMGEPETKTDRGFSIVSDLESKNDRTLADIAYKAPASQLPIIRGQADPGLPAKAPVFDIEVMRARNVEARKKAEMWLKVAAMRK